MRWPSFLRYCYVPRYLRGTYCHQQPFGQPMLEHQHKAKRRESLLKQALFRIVKNSIKKWPRKINVEWLLNAIAGRLFFWKFCWSGPWWVARKVLCNLIASQISCASALWGWGAAKWAAHCASKDAATVVVVATGAAVVAAAVVAAAPYKNIFFKIHFFLFADLYFRALYSRSTYFCVLFSISCFSVEKITWRCWL